MDGCFNGPATPFYLAHQHRALYGSDAKVSHPVLASMLGEASLCFLSDEERRELVAYDLKDQIEVLADELSFSGTSLPIVPKGQPRVMAKLFCSSTCARNHCSNSCHEVIS